MNFNYYFEVAAFILTSIIIYDMRRKGQFYRKDAKLFFDAVCCQATFSAVDLLSCILLKHTDTVPLWVNIAVLCVYFVLQAFVLFLMDNFIFAYANRRIKKDSFSYIISVILCGANLLIVFLTPFFDLYYYIDEAGLYHQGSFAAVGYYFYFFNMLLILGFVATHSNKFLAIEINCISVSVVVVTAATFLQFNSRASLILGMANSMAMLLWYVTLENPNSYIDKVTSCGNREALRRRMEAWNTHKRTHAILFVDLENLKQIEANIGYENTEKFNRIVADFFKKNSAKQKDVYRVSDNTFAIVCHGPVTVNQELGNIVRSRFMLPWVLDEDTSIQAHAQASLAEYPTHFVDFTSLLELQGYVRYYLSKHKTRDMLVVGDEIFGRWQRYKAVEAALRKAIINETLDVYYQPIYDSKKKKIVSLEALARLIDPELGFIPPDEFVAIAETTGLIISMGELVLKKVCQFMSENLVDELSEVRMEVNLSPHQMIDRSAVEKLEEVIKEYGIDPTRINFEVTESATSDSPEQLTQAMNYMKSFGTGFMLDDYGTGYSNITYLAKFDLDYIKFDKTLVWSYFENEISKHILDKEFELMSNLGKEIVVEGIETQDQFDALNELNITYFQGYLFAKALPENEIIEFLKKPSPTVMF